MFNLFCYLGFFPPLNVSCLFALAFSFHLIGHIILCSQHKAPGFARCQSPETLARKHLKPQQSFNTSPWKLVTFFFLARAALVQHDTQFPATACHKWRVFPLISHKKNINKHCLCLCGLDKPAAHGVVTPCHTCDHAHLVHAPIQIHGQMQATHTHTRSLSKSSRLRLMARVHLWASFLPAAPKVAPPQLIWFT